MDTFFAMRRTKQQPAVEAAAPAAQESHPAPQGGSALQASIPAEGQVEVQDGHAPAHDYTDEVGPTPVASGALMDVAFALCAHSGRERSVDSTSTYREYVAKQIETALRAGADPNERDAVLLQFLN